MSFKREDRLNASYPKNNLVTGKGSALNEISSSNMSGQQNNYYTPLLALFIAARHNSAGQCEALLSTSNQLNSTQQENTDAAVRLLYVRISIIKPNYKNNITL